MRLWELWIGTTLRVVNRECQSYDLDDACLELCVIRELVIRLGSRSIRGSIHGSGKTAYCILPHDNGQYVRKVSWKKDWNVNLGPGGSL